jgi:hypothetical protein
MKRSFLTLGLGAACAFVSAQAQTVSTGPAASIELTAAQAAEGETAYDRACRQCHGRDLDDGDFALRCEAQCFCGNGLTNPSQDCSPTLVA